ncbi:MAG: hypothetical protein ABFS12_00130 [Bacteroidota bacterium]
MIYKNKLLIILIFSIFSTMLGQSNSETTYSVVDTGSGGSGIPQNYLKPLYKPNAFGDRGTAFLSVGNIHVGGIENYGSIGGWRQPPIYTYMPLRLTLSEFSTINCAYPPGGPKDLEGKPAIDSLSIAGKGKTYNYAFMTDVPTWNYQFTDWEAADGARGQEFSGEVFANNGKAILATSTNPKTWPKGYTDENGNWVSTPGERHWPGHWAIDPETGKEIPGQFAADEEVFFRINDKYHGLNPGGPEESGAPIGLEYEIQAYSFARSYAKDFMFWNFKLSFTGDPDYDGEIELSAVDSLYTGLFLETGAPMYYIHEGGGMQWIGTGDDGLFYDRAKFIREKNLLITYDEDDFHTHEVYTGEVPRLGWALVKKPIDRTGKAWDITQWHWFDYYLTWRDYEINDRRMFYTISGDETILQGAREKEDWDHDIDNDGFDEPELITDEVNLTSELGIGPLRLEPGDTLEWAMVVIVGYTDEEIIEKLELAQGMVDNNFIGPQAPPSPTLHATGTKLTEEGDPLRSFDVPIVYSNDSKVTLYWDDLPEDARDPITGDADFEGYKIYRSVNLGQTWGTAGNDEAFVTDETGTFVKWLPIEQLDKNNGVKGRSEIDPTFYLGDDTGLKHSWVDSTVIPGLRYRYTITSYDAGVGKIVPLESAMGSSPSSINTVDVIVGTPPNGIIPVESSIEHTSGHSDAIVNMTIIDPFLVKGNQYKFTFSTNDPSSQDSTRVTITNVTSGNIIVDEVLMPNSDRTSEEVFPIIDGIQFFLQDTPQGIISIEDQDGTDLNSATNSDGNGRIVVSVTDESPVSYYKGNDYEIRFLDSIQLSFAYNENMTWAGRFGARPYNYWSPIEVWNISDPSNIFQLHWMMDDKRPKNNTFQSEDEMYIMEIPFSIEDSAGTGETGMWPDTNVPNTPGDWPLDWSAILKIKGASDSLGNENWAIPNVDKIIIKSHHYLTVEDEYIINTEPTQIKESQIDVSKVKVVPNPYYVRASWERDEISKKILFTNLPPKCKISIFTLSAEHIIDIYHDNSTVGHTSWDLRTKENMEVAYGLYIYRVESEWGDYVGKFSLIR